MSLTLGMSDDELAVKLAATQTAVVCHCTSPNVLPFINVLLAFNETTPNSLTTIPSSKACSLSSASSPLYACYG